MRRAASLIVALIVVLAVAVTLAIRSYQHVPSASHAEQPPSPAIAPAPAQKPAQPSAMQETAPAPQPTEQAATPSAAAPSAAAQSPTSAATPEVAKTPPSPPVPAAAPVPAPTQAPVQELHAASDSTANGVAQQVLPDVPAKAIRTISGTVKVAIRVNVDPNGSVSDATMDSQGPSQYFANLALKAAKAWKFTPQSDGQNAPRAWSLEFLFRQSGVEASASEVAH
jgi:TonB family protein